MCTDFEQSSFFLFSWNGEFVPCYICILMFQLFKVSIHIWRLRGSGPLLPSSEVCRAVDVVGVTLCSSWNLLHHPPGLLAAPGPACDFEGELFRFSRQMPPRGADIIRVESRSQLLFSFSEGKGEIKKGSGIEREQRVDLSNARSRSRHNYAGSNVPWEAKAPDFSPCQGRMGHSSRQ